MGVRGVGKRSTVTTEVFEEGINQVLVRLTPQQRARTESVDDEWYFGQWPAHRPEGEGAIEGVELGEEVELRLEGEAESRLRPEMELQNVAITASTPRIRSTPVA